MDTETSDKKLIRINRSAAVTGKARWLCALPLIFFSAYVVIIDVRWASWDVAPLLGFYSFVAAVTFTIMLSGVFWRTFKHLPPAEGRVLAIVPVYNEDPELVKAAVLSLTQQTRPPQAIYVVDDGSRIPLATFDHPLVTWVTQANAGKRHAQANVLKRFSPNAWDYILTVDSDSVCDPDALEHLMRAMSNPKVKAATGMIFVRNWKKNLLTKLTDINVVTSCLMFRMFRSWMGLVTPTSGALALYRANLVYDNLDDYLTSGTAGDDRRLSFYALMRGEVVGVHESVVETALPETWNGIFYQRLRWSKSAWLGIPFVLTNLKALPTLLYMYPMVFALMWPFVVGIMIKLSFVYNSPVILYGVLFWLIVAISMTAVYAIYRPGFTTRERWTQFALSPLYPILGLVILRPAAYWALTKLKSTSWHTREVDTFEPLVDTVPVHVDAH